MALLKNYCDAEITVIRKTQKFDPRTRQIIDEVTEEKIPCGRKITVREEFYNHEVPELATEVIKLLECGHFLIEKLIPLVKPDNLRHPILWNRLLPYQKKSVHFLEKNKGRALLAHDVGLGKTVISLSYIRENPETRSKICLIVTQAGDIYRWQEEAMQWFGFNENLLSSTEEFISLYPNVYYRTGQKLSPIGNIVIASWTRLSEDKFVEQLKERGISCVILDESHMYKNESSKRTRNLQDLIRWADSQNGSRVPVVFLTATPITNRLSEYTTTLNILDPDSFPSKDAVLRYCTYDYVSRKHLGLSEHARERFFGITKKYILRETAKSVNLPLPPKQEIPVTIDIFQYRANEQFVEEYNETLDLLEQEINSTKPDSASILGYMSQLRRLTGMMKVMTIAQMARDFLLNNPNEKLTIGVHHITVREWLVKLLLDFKPLSMSDETPDIKDAIEKKFKEEPQHRVLIASIISAGQGRNLQFCRNAILAERQWNRKREEQFIGRFHRIIKNADGTVKTNFTDSDTVRIWILTAGRTFDEFFEKMVQFKGIVCETADEAADDIPDMEFIKELAREMVKTRLKWVGV